MVDGHHVGPKERIYTRRRECNRCRGRFNTTEAVMERIELLIPEGVTINATAPSPVPRRQDGRAKAPGKPKK